MRQLDHSGMKQMLSTHLTQFTLNILPWHRVYLYWGHVSVQTLNVQDLYVGSNWVSMVLFEDHFNRDQSSGRYSFSSSLFSVCPCVWSSSPPPPVSPSLLQSQWGAGGGAGGGARGQHAASQAAWAAMSHCSLVTGHYPVNNTLIGCCYLKTQPHFCH